MRNQESRKNTGREIVTLESKIQCTFYTFFSISNSNCRQDIQRNKKKNSNKKNNKISIN